MSKSLKIFLKFKNLKIDIIYKHYDYDIFYLLFGLELLKTIVFYDSNKEKWSLFEQTR